MASDGGQIHIGDRGSRQRWGMMRFVRILRCCVGVVFVLAGIGKLLDVNSFARVVAEIAHVSIGTGSVIGTLLIEVEIVCGSMLLLNIKPRIAGLLLLSLAASFAWLHLSSILTGRVVKCGCFGALNFDLPAGTDVLIDLGVIDAVFICESVTAWIGNGTHAAIQRSWQRAAVLVFGIFIGILEIDMIRLSFPGSSPDDQGGRFGAAMEFLASKDTLFGANQNRSRALAYISFSDFNCSVCFDDFLRLCGELTASDLVDVRENMVGLIRDNEGPARGGKERLDRWCVATGIPFHVYAAPDSIFRAAQFVRSFVAVVDRGGEVVFRDEFPMPGAAKERLLSLLGH